LINHVDILAKFLHCREKEGIRIVRAVHRHSYDLLLVVLFDGASVGGLAREIDEP
jgi:hypothetical protein